MQLLFAACGGGGEAEYDCHELWSFFVSVTQFCCVTESLLRVIDYVLKFVSLFRILIWNFRCKIHSQLTLSPSCPPTSQPLRWFCPGHCSSWGGTMLEFRTPTAVVLPPLMRRCRSSFHITCSRELRPAWMNSHKVWSRSTMCISPRETVTIKQLCLITHCSGWGVWSGGHSGAEEDPDHGEQVSAAAAGGGWGEAAAHLAPGALTFTQARLSSKGWPLFFSTVAFQPIVRNGDDWSDLQPGGAQQPDAGQTHGASGPR